MIYLIAHQSITAGVLPRPIVVASLTDDPALTTGMDLHKAMVGMAGRLGLTQFEVVHGDAAYTPGQQLHLPLTQGGKS